MRRAQHNDTITRGISGYTPLTVSSTNMGEVRAYTDMLTTPTIPEPVARNEWQAVSYEIPPTVPASRVIVITDWITHKFDKRIADMWLVWDDFNGLEKIISELNIMAFLQAYLPTPSNITCIWDDDSVYIFKHYCKWIESLWDIRMARWILVEYGKFSREKENLMPMIYLTQNQYDILEWYNAVVPWYRYYIEAWDTRDFAKVDKLIDNLNKGLHWNFTSYFV